MRARADLQTVGEGLTVKSGRSLVVRSRSARLRTVGVLHIVIQKVTEQLAAHIDVTSKELDSSSKRINAKLLPLQNESGLILLPQGNRDMAKLARQCCVDCFAAWWANNPLLLARQTVSEHRVVLQESGTATTQNKAAMTKYSVVPQGRLSG